MENRKELRRKGKHQSYKFEMQLLRNIASGWSSKYQRYSIKRLKTSAMSKKQFKNIASGFNRWDRNN